MTGRIDNVPGVAQMRVLAKSRLPKAVFDFIDGGAEDEASLRSNREDFSRYAFVPRVLRDVAAPNLECRVLGSNASMPVIIAPTGLAGLAWPGAERLLASAAARQQIPFTLGALGSCDIEDIASTDLARKWFQLYVLKDRQVTHQLIERAEQSGYETLVVTVDVPVVGKRERDVVNGFTVPLKWSPRMCWEMISHPAWSLQTLQHGVPMMESLVPYADVDTRSAAAHAFWINSAFDPSASWEDLEKIRDAWKGKLLIKGVLSHEDATHAMRIGAEGIVVSNHGGRQLDGALSSIQALDNIAVHVDGQLELIVDSGIRRGSDVVKALCLGASAVMIGRPSLYGAAAGAEAGITRVLDIFREEIARTLALLGVDSVEKLDRSYLES